MNFTSGAGFAAQALADVVLKGLQGSSQHRGFLLN
jgi:hypothetical protein